MKSVFMILLILFIYLSTNIRAWGQEIGLLELAKQELFLIKGASLWLESPLEAPNPTMVYPGYFLKRFGFTNIRDFLDYLPSFYLVQDINERVVSWRGLYTTSSNAFLFLEEEQRLDLPAFGSFILDASYPVLDIRSLEIVSGPASSLYGTNAMSGLIQVYRDSKDKLSLWGNMGENGESGFTSSMRLKNFYGIFNYYTIPGENYQGVPLNPRRDNYSLILKGTAWDTPFQLFYFDNKYDTPRSQRGIPLKPEDRVPYGSEEEVKLFSVGFKKALNFEKFTLYFQPTFTSFQAHTPQVKTPHGYGTFTALDIELENQRFSLLTYLDLPLGRDRFLLGFEGWEIYHKRYKSKIFSGSESVSVLPKESELNYAFFLQYKKPLGDFIFHIGLRFDSYELWGERLTPRIAINYQINPKLGLQFNYSEAFNAPSLFYARANPILGYGAASGLRPEVLKNHSLNLLYHSEPLNFRITGYLNTLKDKIGLDPIAKVYTNLSEIKTAGLEAELIYDHDSLLAFLNYSYLSVLKAKNAPNVYDCEYIFAIPKQMLKGGLSVKVPGTRGLSLGPAFKWFSKAYFSNLKIDAYTLWDFNVLYERKNWDINLKIENLFDKHYKRAGSLPPVPWEGRHFRLGLRFHY